MTLHDRTVATVVAELKQVRRSRDRLLAYRGEDDQWCDVRADDINHYLREASGLDVSAKDLRTWHGTLRAAVALARSRHPTSQSAARRVVAAVMREVAEDLGNTPAVARSSYVDPRVVEAFLQGETLDLSTRSRDCGPGAEKALLRLLGD